MDTLSKSQYVGLIEFKKINENLDYQPKFKWSVNIDQFNQILSQMVLQAKKNVKEHDKLRQQ